MEKWRVLYEQQGIRTVTEDHRELQSFHGETKRK